MRYKAHRWRRITSAGHRGGLPHHDDASASPARAERSRSTSQATRLRRHGAVSTRWTVRYDVKRAVLVLILGCLATASAAAADLRIGVAAPLTGPDAVFGMQIRRGVEQSVMDANAAGGFNGEQARVDARDDGNEPKKAGDVARSFVQAGVPIVVGHLSSAASVPAAAIYGEAGTLEIAPMALAPSLTERGLPTVFRMCGRDDEQAGVAARYLLSRHVGRVAVVHDRTSAGKALADGVREALARAGTREVFYGSAGRGGDAGLVERIKASAAQVVFFGGGTSDAGLLARQLRDANARASLMGGTALASEDYPSQAGAAADGTLLVFPEDAKARPTAAALLRRLRGVGFEPDASFFYGYAAVEVVQQAARAARSLEPAALAAAMHGGRVFKTVLGDIAFDAKGDLTATDGTIQLWHRGAYGRMTLDRQAKT